jgi:hypothetical protein
VTAALAASLVISASGAETVAAQQQSRNDPPAGLERLWQEYPLEPDESDQLGRPGEPDTNEAPPETPPATERRPAAEAPTVAGTEPPTGTGEASPSGLSTLALLAITLGSLTAMVAVTMIILAARPDVAEAVWPHSGRRRRPQGGFTMADLFRRLRERDTPGGDKAGVPSREALPAERLAALDPYSLERSASMEPERGEPTAHHADPAVDPGEEGTVTTAADLGQHVTALIGTAQQAAEKMQREAAADAERIRAEAREDAKALIAEATRETEAIREDTAIYSREARQAADAYAGETRSEAEAYSSRLRAEAEENARELRAAAEQEAKRIEKDARGRREVLTGEVERFEERLRRLHTVFQGITMQLDALLGNGTEQIGEDPSPGEIEESPTPEVSKNVPA